MQEVWEGAMNASSFRLAIRSVVIDAMLLPERWRSGVAYNPLSVRVAQDPYPTYAKLRTRDPVHHSRHDGCVAVHTLQGCGPHLAQPPGILQQPAQTQGIDSATQHLQSGPVRCPPPQSQPYITRSRHPPLSRSIPGAPRRPNRLRDAAGTVPLHTSSHRSPDIPHDHRAARLRSPCPSALREFT